MRNPAPDMRSITAMPWALVKRNGATEGKRPNTMMMFLQQRDMTPGNIPGWFGWVARHTRRGWTKNPGWVADEDIVKRWPVRPSVRQINTAKHALPKTEIENA